MNFGTPVPLLIGIVLILGAIALFFLDKLKPGYGRDSDKVYAILWLISGVFLLGHLTMELLASFQQLIMTGMLIAVTIENVLSRKPKDARYAAQGLGDMPMEPEPYRPSRSQSYRNNASSRMNVRAELDNEAAFGGRFTSDRRMLRGRDEQPPRRSSYYGNDYVDSYADDERAYDQRPSSMAEERPVGRLNPSNDRIRRRRPKALDGRYDDASASWDESQSSYGSSGGGGYSSHAESASSSPYSANGDADSYADYRSTEYPNDESRPPSRDY
ncbi:MAG: Ycf66 family protein, partial [Cyanobacteria bacterium P01_H01_bin.58]